MANHSIVHVSNTANIATRYLLPFEGARRIKVNKWTKETIVTAVRDRHGRGEAINYASVVATDVALLRAATRYFGSWKVAVENSGITYGDCRQYQSWSMELIVDKIKELNSQGVDLSWRNISSKVDPQLAAAATKAKHFGSWRLAITAAGLDYKTIRRYQQWSKEVIIENIKDLHAAGTELNAKAVEQMDISLITAARRKFGSWDQALTAAGLDYKTIVQRKPFKRKKSEAVANAL